MRRRSFAVALAALALLGVPTAVRAHAGHAHTVMGTVTMHHEEHLEVKTTEGKTVMILIDGRTSVLRGKTKIDPEILKEGDRVVVDVGDGKEPFLAKSVRVGGSKASPARK